MKLCTNCQHFQQGACRRPIGPKTTSPVTGQVEVVRSNVWALYERASYGFLGRSCGPRARYFAPTLRHRLVRWITGIC